MHPEDEMFGAPKYVVNSLLCGVPEDDSQLEGRVDMAAVSISQRRPRTLSNHRPSDINTSIAWLQNDPAQLMTIAWSRTSVVAMRN